MANTKQTLLKVQVSDLQKLIAPIFSIAENNPTIPILKSLKLAFDAETGTLSATASDLGLQGTSSLKIDDVAGSESFSLCIQAKKTHDIMNALSGSAVATLELESSPKSETQTPTQTLKIKVGKSKFSLGTLPSVDFPEMKIDENAAQSEFSLDESLVGTFKHQLATVRGSAATNDVRFYFMGVLFETIGNDFRLTATDSFRLTRNHFTIPDEMAANMNTHCQLIIGNKGVSEIAKFIGNTENLNFVFFEKILLLKATQKNGVNLEMVLKSIDGKFPDVGRVIPSKDNIVAKIQGKAAELGSSIKRLLVLNDSKNNIVQMNADENVVSFTYKNQSHEVGEEALENAKFTQKDGCSLEEASLYCNGAFLIDAVSLAAKDGMNFVIYLQENPESKSLLFKMNDPENKDNEDWKNYIHVLMPAKL